MASILEIILKAKDNVSEALKGLTKNMKQTGEELKAVGTGMTIAGAAVTAGLGLVTKSAADFQKQMAFVATMLDNQSKDLLPEFEEKLTSMAATYGESTETLSRGLYDILSAGIDATKAIDVLDASVRAGKAGLTNAGVAADALTTLINSYGLAAEDATDISDLLFSIVKRGKTTFDELAPVIGRVASLASQGGLSIEEMGASLATMTRSGIRTEMAVTSLRSVVQAFIKPTKEAKEAAKELGLELTSQTLREQGLVKVTEILSKASESQRTSIFGNIQAFAGLSTILGDTTGYMQDLDTMTNRAGTTEEAFNITTKTLTDGIARLREAVLNIARSYGKTLIPAAEKAVGSLTKFSKLISKIPQPIKGFTTSLALVSGALLTVGGSSIFLVGKLLTTIAAIKKSAAAMKILGLVTKAAFIEFVAGIAIIIAVKEGLDALIRMKEKHIKESEKELIVLKKAKRLRDSGNLSIRDERRLTKLLKQGRKESIEVFLNNHEKQEKARQDAIDNAKKQAEEEERLAKEKAEREKEEAEEREKKLKKEKKIFDKSVSEREGTITEEYNLRRKLREFDLADVILNLEKQIQAEKKGSIERAALEQSLADFRKALSIESAAKVSQLQDDIQGNLEGNLVDMLMAEKTFGEGVEDMWKNLHKMIIQLIVRQIVEEKAAAILRIAAEKAIGAAKALSAHAGIPFVGVALGIAATVALISQIGKFAKFEGGGRVPGARGMPVPAIVHGEETIRTPEQEARLNKGLTFIININGTLVEADKTKWLRIWKEEIFPVAQQDLRKVGQEFK